MVRKAACQAKFCRVSGMDEGSIVYTIVQTMLAKCIPDLQYASMPHQLFSFNFCASLINLSDWQIRLSLLCACKLTSLLVLALRGNSIVLKHDVEARKQQIRHATYGKSISTLIAQPRQIILQTIGHLRDAQRHCFQTRVSERPMM